MLLRKFLRLILLSIPLVYFYCSRRAVILIVLVFIIPLIIFEILRFLNDSLREKLNKKLRWIIKPQEEKRITGITFLFLGIFVVVNYFEKDVAILALTIALVYDFFSYFGKNLGKVRIGEKTLEGALLGTVISYLVAWHLRNVLTLDKNIIISAILSAPLIELFLSWPDDNFTLPFLVALVSQFVKNSF